MKKDTEGSFLRIMQRQTDLILFMQMDGISNHMLAYWLIR